MESAEVSEPSTPVPKATPTGTQTLMSQSDFLGKIIVYSILGCPHCMKAKQTLKSLDLPFVDIRLDIYPHIRKQVSERSGMTTVPQIYFNSVLVGGNDDLKNLVDNKSQLAEYIENVKHNPMPLDGPIIPDEKTAVSETDLFLFQSEPDEYFALITEMDKAQLIKTSSGGFFSSRKSYFTGREFVEWVKAKKSVDESRAMEMGQMLVNRNIIKASTGKDFEKSTKSFFIVEYSNSDALNNGPVSSLAPKSAGEIGENMRKIILKLYAVYLSPDGKHVDYQGMKSSDEFKAYKRLSQKLLRVEVVKVSREEKLAFFINIYNALVIHATIERGAPTGLWSRYKFFNNSKYIIGAQPYSLQDIENGVLRANRKGVGQLCVPFGSDDPRLRVALDRHEPLIHFALVCGAKSCPPIKTFTAQDIYEELNIAAQSFLEGEDGLMLDKANKTIKLSSILKWYSVDFGSNKAEVLEFVANHMSEGPKLQELKELMKGGNYKVEYMKYDWSSNSK